MTEQSMFARVLGDEWFKLPAELRAVHSVHDTLKLTGMADVQRNGNAMIDVIGKLAGLPRAGTDIPLTVTMERTSDGEIWTREFAEHNLRSRLRPSPKPHRTQEVAGPLRVEMELRREGQTIVQRDRRTWFLGIPLPSFLAPASRAREFVEDGCYRFDVTVHAPFGFGLLMAYQGWLMPDAVSPSVAKDRQEH